MPKCAFYARCQSQADTLISAEHLVDDSKQHRPATQPGTQCVQVLRKDWLNVARGIFTLGYWRRTLTTHPSYSWYLSRVRDTVQHALDDSGASQVTLVGHSAGGWLARAFTGDAQWFPGTTEAGAEGRASRVPNPAVGAIVTLGSPQAARPPGAAWLLSFWRSSPWTCAMYCQSFLVSSRLLIGRALRTCDPLLQLQVHEVNHVPALDTLSCGSTCWIHQLV